MAVQEDIQKEYFNKIGITGRDYDKVYKHMTKKAHNMFLYMLSGAGILGFIAFLMLLVAYTVYFWRTWKVVMLQAMLMTKSSLSVLPVLRPLYFQI